MRARLSAHSDFLMVLVLFVSFRLMILLLFTPASFLTRGYTDHIYYFDMAALSDQSHFPFIDYWFEYPPVFTYLAIGIYRLTRMVNEYFAYFSRALALALLPFEMLVLTNLYRIGRRLYDMAMAVRIAWVYTALVLPMFFWLYSFDTMVAALVLQTVYWLLVGRRSASAIVLGIAIATKFTPAFVLSTAWRFACNVRQAVGYTVAVVIVAGLIFLPFLIASPTFTIASLQSLMSVSSWETIWALIDGNIGYGDVGALPRHFDLSLASVPMHNPPVVSPWIAILVFGVLFLFVYSRPVDRTNPRHLLVFTGVILMLFHLWSKGWSPQWVTLVLPFLLLLYPNWRGVLLSLILSLASLLDWPLAFAMGSSLIYAIGVLTRASLFVLIGVDLYLELMRRQTDPANA